MRSLETFDLSAAIVNVFFGVEDDEQLNTDQIRRKSGFLAWGHWNSRMIVCADAKSDAPESR